jgi:hypothetical protein
MEPPHRCAGRDLVARHVARLDDRDRHRGAPGVERPHPAVAEREALGTAQPVDGHGQLLAEVGSAQRPPLARIESFVGCSPREQLRPAVGRRDTDGVGERRCETVAVVDGDDVVGRARVHGGGHARHGAGGVRHSVGRSHRGDRDPTCGCGASRRPALLSVLRRRSSGGSRRSAALRRDEPGGWSAGTSSVADHPSGHPPDGPLPGGPCRQHGVRHPRGTSTPNPLVDSASRCAVLSVGGSGSLV